MTDITIEIRSNGIHKEANLNIKYLELEDIEFVKKIALLVNQYSDMEVSKA